MLSDYQKYVQKKMTEWQGKPIRLIQHDAACPHSVVIWFHDGTALRIDTDNSADFIHGVMPTPFNLPQNVVGLA